MKPIMVNRSSAWKLNKPQIASAAPLPATTAAGRVSGRSRIGSLNSEIAPNSSTIKAAAPNGRGIRQREFRQTHPDPTAPGAWKFSRFDAAQTGGV